jgi:hypothetical protein
MRSFSIVVPSVNWGKIGVRLEAGFVAFQLRNVNGNFRYSDGAGLKKLWLREGHCSVKVCLNEGS